MDRADTGAPSPIVGPLAEVIREGFGVFLALQATRYRLPEDPLHMIPAAMMTKTITGPTPVGRELSAPEWSEAYRRCLQPLTDNTVNSVWGLVSMVLHILTNGSAHTVNASSAYCGWYRAFKLEEEKMEEQRQELASARLSSCSEVDVEEIGIFFLDLIERCFFAGAFETAASLIETLMETLRTGAAFNPFSSEVESCVANVKRLLLASYTDEHSFAAWQSDANDQIFDAKRVLLDGATAGSGRGTTACVRVAGSLCTLCLNILLAISGDMLLVRQRCQEGRHTLLGYLAALCTVSIPFKSLSELREVVAAAIVDWTGEEDDVWLQEVVLRLFEAESLEGVVKAMGAVGGMVAARFPWDPTSVVTSNVESDDEDEELVHVEEQVQMNSVSSRRFALAFMAAHVADICSPPVTALSLEISLTFTRNDLVSDYVRLFSNDPVLWKPAATYMAYSPFMNPVSLYHTVTGVAAQAALSNATYLGVCTLYRTLLDTRSAHQVLTRRLLRERLGDHPTLIQWLDAFDHFRDEAYGDVHRYIINTRFNRGDTGVAAWMAVEMQLPMPFQYELKCVLRSSSALEDDYVYRVGEAVQNSFLSLDVCPTAELTHSLLACAAISEYRRAAAAVEALRQDPTTPIAAMLRSSAWCLQCIENTIGCIDACHFFFHPATIFSLVEHGADTLLSMRSIMHKVGFAAYANLAEPVLPALQHAFAMCQIHNSPASLPTHLRERVESITEKLNSALESHAL